jgi:hypothetical protein
LELGITLLAKVSRNLTAIGPAIDCLSQLRVSVVRIKKLTAEDGAVREPRRRGISTVGNHYQATASED